MMRNLASELTIEELKGFKYPNLMAEVKETTYSICTIAEFMELPGPRRKEDDPETWDKLTGRKKLSCKEAVGLAKLFGVSIEYLFSDELELVCGQTTAHWSWFDERRRQEKEAKRDRLIREIERKLKEKPYILEFVREAVTWSPEQLEGVIDTLEKRNTA